MTDIVTQTPMEQTMHHRVALARERIAGALALHSGRIALACSFGAATGMALLDLVLQGDLDIPVFYADTGLMFDETHRLAERVAARYGIAITRLEAELSLGEQERIYGAALWASDPDRCCALRKVQPTRAFLARYDAWFTGIRRADGETRRTAGPATQDGELIKYAPLFDWTDDDVAAYVAEHDIPVNPLHARGYPSLGCTPCTRAVRPGEDPRSGRWPGFAKTECGLHMTVLPPARSERSI